ncbi:MAG: hypothetical protein KJ687_08770, partial [Proteobacteria bacterium]|nr:hypothetical protein [Pseudomonadota bacterium]
VSFGGFDVTEIINNELYSERNGVQLYHLLHFWTTKKLLKTVEVKTFLFTYENNPWEKMCMQAIRTFSPSTRIIGYQHNVITQASAGMFVGGSEREIAPMPDKILTVGKAPMQIMEKYGCFRRGEIEPACALRFEYLFNRASGKQYTRRDGKTRVLLPLEGIFNVYKMVNYAIRELGGDENFQVVIRTHPDPILPFSAFAHKLVSSIDSLSNFSISQNRSLIEDIEWADIVMYWGTTVSLESLVMGKPVIHYSMESILSYDPLFECRYLKRTVSDQDELKPVIKHFFSLTEKEFLEEQEKAKAYLDSYFYPISENGFEKFIT